MKPKITRCSPSPLVIVEGESVSIVCYATGEPKPSFRWFKDGKPIKSKFGTSYYYVPRTNGMDLKIIIARKSEEGFYTCVAENKLGNSTCKPVQISVTRGTANVRR